MRLADWMSMNGVNDDQMAERVAVDRATISRIRRGKHKPSWPILLRLQEITMGAVTPNDFMKSSP